jgi:hypothetical protein
VDLRIRSPEDRTWDMRVKQDGSRSFRADRSTGSDGEFRIRRQRPNTRGTDTIVFHAYGPGSQECHGRNVF